MFWIGFFAGLAVGVMLMLLWWSMTYRTRAEEDALAQSLLKSLERDAFCERCLRSASRSQYALRSCREDEEDDDDAA